MRDRSEEILALIDIVDIVGETVGLKSVGENYKGPCPFHADADPSFVVSPGKQIFKCFGGGCGVGGNVAHFVSLRDDISYYEAMTVLAKGVGRPDLAEGLVSQTYGSVFDLNAIVQKLYAEVLFSKTEGSVKARQFLRDRRITQDTARLFGLGYGPNAWTWLKNQRLDVEQLMEANLVSDLESKAPGRDFMKNRIAFPIHYQGKIVGFSGRSIGTSTKIAKYLNSKDSDWFVKGDLLYGWQVNRKQILSTKEVVIVEGNFDVLQLHQRGVDNVVAILGSYIGPRSASFLSKKVKKVIVFADGDKPGIDSALKTGNALQAHGLPVQVIYIEGKDPDDLATRATRFDWEKLKAERMKPLHLFALEHKSMETALEVVGSMANQVSVSYAIRDLANASKFSEGHIEHWLIKYKKSLLGIVDKITIPDHKNSLIEELIILNSAYNVNLMLNSYERKCLEAENVDLSIANDPGFVASLADKPHMLESLFKLEQIEDIHHYAEDLVRSLSVMFLKKDVKRWKREMKTDGTPEPRQMQLLGLIEEAARNINSLQLVIRKRL
jgi:DNA primase catalytic core